jgi:hypothetical protein
MPFLCVRWQFGISFPNNSYNKLFDCSGGFVFLRDDNLETGITLCRRIHRLVGKDNCRARSYDLPGLGQELSRQPTFLRHQEEALTRAYNSC